MNADIKKNRIFDRSSYPSKVIDTFELISAFYIDMYYNYFYFEAKKIKNNGTVETITDAYKHVLASFSQSLNDPSLFINSLKAMHTFITKNADLYTISFTEWLERIVEGFLPEWYYDDATTKHKNAIIKTVLSSTNNEFIKKLLKEYLSMVIDNHTEKDNIRILQDEFIELLMIEREKIFNKFVIKRGHENDNEEHRALIDSIKKETKKLCSEKYELQTLITKLKKIIIDKDKKYKEALNKIENLNKINTELKEQLNTTRTPEIEKSHHIILEEEEPKVEDSPSMWLDYEDSFL